MKSGLSKKQPYFSNDNSNSNSSDHDDDDDNNNGCFVKNSPVIVFSSILIMSYWVWGSQGLYVEL